MSKDVNNVFKDEFLPLIQKVKEWHAVRETPTANPHSQYVKLMEEQFETYEAYSTSLDERNPEYMDGLGDQIVVVQGLLMIYKYDEEKFWKDVFFTPQEPQEQGYLKSNKNLASSIARGKTDVIYNDLLTFIQVNVKKDIPYMVECLQMVYDIISKRTGKMVDGVWVKSSDLQDVPKGD